MLPWLKPFTRLNRFEHGAAQQENALLRQKLDAVVVLLFDVSSLAFDLAHLEL